MDDILRVLQRRFQSLEDQESAHLYIAALERAAYGPSDTRDAILDEILIDLLLDHLNEDDGVRGFTMNATNNLIKLMFGSEAASRYRALAGQHGFEYADLELLLQDIGLQCSCTGHRRENSPCVYHYGKIVGEGKRCQVVGCSCPGCEYIRWSKNDEYNICSHHLEIIETYGLEYLIDREVEFE